MMTSQKLLLHALSMVKFVAKLHNIKLSWRWLYFSGVERNTFRHRKLRWVKVLSFSPKSASAYQYSFRLYYQVQVKLGLNLTPKTGAGNQQILSFKVNSNISLAEKLRDTFFSSPRTILIIIVVLEKLEEYIHEYLTILKGSIALILLIISMTRTYASSFLEQYSPIQEGNKEKKRRWKHERWSRICRLSIIVKFSRNQLVHDIPKTTFPTIVDNFFLTYIYDNTYRLRNIWEKLILLTFEL